MHVVEAEVIWEISACPPQFFFEPINSLKK